MCVKLAWGPSFILDSFDHLGYFKVPARINKGEQACEKQK
jgi:hypothetical protein